MKKIVLVKGSRYVHDSVLYIADKTYSVKDEVAEHLLSQETHQGMPVFMLAEENEARRNAARERAIKRQNRETGEGHPV